MPKIDFDTMVATAPREVLGAAVLTENRSGEILRREFERFGRQIAEMISDGRYRDAQAAAREATSKAKSYHDGIRRAVAQEQAGVVVGFERGGRFKDVMAAIGLHIEHLDDTPVNENTTADGGHDTDADPEAEPGQDSPEGGDSWKA